MDNSNDSDWSSNHEWTLPLTIQKDLKPWTIPWTFMDKSNDLNGFDDSLTWTIPAIWKGYAQSNSHPSLRAVRSWWNLSRMMFPLYPLIYGPRYSIILLAKWSLMPTVAKNRQSSLPGMLQNIIPSDGFVRSNLPRGFPLIGSFPALIHLAAWLP